MAGNETQDIQKQNCNVNFYQCWIRHRELQALRFMTSRNHGFTEVQHKIINYSSLTMNIVFTYISNYASVVTSTYLFHQFWSCLTKNASEHMLHQVKSKVSVMLDKMMGYESNVQFELHKSVVYCPVEHTRRSLVYISISPNKIRWSKHSRLLVCVIYLLNTVLSVHYISILH